MKKITAIACSMLMLATGVAAFSGCGKGKEEAKEVGTVMNVSLNPEVEFVLDQYGKVISVNALNEEGNLIVSAEVFTGETAEEAAKLFVKVSAETGFLVEGNASAGENEIEISFSGDTEKAEKLYNNVKSTVQTYLSEENITAQIEQAAAITDAQLREVVAECAPYIDKAKLQALDYMEMVETIAEARQETAGLYSQELKNAYYEMKAFTMQQAELETIKAHLGVIEKAAVDIAFAGYTLAVDTIETTRLTMLVNDSSPYQVALRAFQAAKTEYLNYREYVASLEQTEVTTAISQQLALLQTAVDQTEATLLKAGEDANAALDTAKASVQTTYDTVIKAIGNYSALANEYAEEVSANVQLKSQMFYTQFEEDYAAVITSARTNWANMKAALQESETVA
ncbi:MAG: hypothetical protein E7366_04125 [Clostridiales bacterium]|nr:hypothetical protein [Clostridiales bacterium]